ncbi:MAG: hypothetical protein KDD25_00535 [Bdellovibrionales bacterium]|nr:hypothetical protein [Bdellovibrionales bacterium]
MRSRNYVVIIVVIFAWSVTSSAKLQVKDLLRDANFASRTADHYKALRNFNYIRGKAPNSLVEMGIGQYLASLRVVGTEREVLEACQEMIKNVKKNKVSRLAYHCAKSLATGRYAPLANSFIKKISKKSEFYPYALVVDGALKMREGDGTSCIKRLSESLKVKFEKEGIVDLYHLTRARCYISSHKFEEAISEYQRIGQESPHYFQGLSEVGWLFFKTRNLERANEVFNIIAAAHKSIGYNGGKGVNDRMYFEAKYLRAYMDVLKRSTEYSVQRFNQLKVDAEAKYRAEEFFNGNVVGKIQKIVEKDSSQWIDIASSAPTVRDFIEFASNWVDQKLFSNLVSSLELSISLGKEKKRISKLEFSGREDYLASIDRLMSASNNEVGKKLTEVVTEANRSIKSVQIKAEMGKLELEWVDRNEGVRDANELLKGFQDSVRSVEDYLGG